MIRPDLHLHTTASDGIYDAAQIARLVQRANVTFFSVTDHDTVDALPQAADAAHPAFRDLSVRIHPWNHNGRIKALPIVSQGN